MGCGPSLYHDFGLAVVKPKYPVGTRVAAVKFHDIKQFRNPHTGQMQDHLMGATWSTGVVSEIKEVRIVTHKYHRSVAGSLAMSAAGHDSNPDKTRVDFKYAVAFDDGTTEVDIPVDRVRPDESPLPARAAEPI